MHKRFRSLYTFLIAAVILMTAFSHPVSAASGGWLDTKVPYANIEEIRLNFVCPGKKVCAWNFPYTDEFFLRPSEEFTIELAQASMGLTLSAFRYNGDPIENQFEAYLGAVGFTDITPFGYDKETSKDTLSGLVACKKIGDFTLIAAAPNGWGYKNEWSGNLEVGGEERHTGFNNAAKILETQILQFIEEHSLSGKLKLWVTGFSRAAAVGNLTAADMIELGRFEDVYAYLYGVPRTTKAAKLYPGIFNICGKYDPVPQVAPESWGFERYGTDLYTPAEETDTRYAWLQAKADEVFNAITGNRMRNNPELNYQLHMILEFVYEMFPDQESYLEEFQGILVKTWSDKSVDNLLETLLSALNQLEKLDSRQAYSSRILKEYLSYVIAQHIGEQQSQVEQGRWDPDLSVGENILREHMPYTYISWLFADADPNELLNGHAYTRRVVITADADVEVLQDGEVIGGADRQGKIINLQGCGTGREDGAADSLENMRSICAIRNGKKTVLNLPMNGSYTVRIRTYSPANIAYYDVICSPFTTFGDCRQMHMLRAGAGVYTLEADHAEELSDIRAESGRPLNVQHMNVRYSAALMMADEADSADTVTLTELLQTIFYAVLFTLGLVIVCLVIGLLHRRGRKWGREYSELYIIIPHLVLILLFGLLTFFFTANMFAIGTVRSAFAFLTVFVMFLLALRGLLRKRCAYNWAVTAFLFAASIVNAFIYQRSRLVSASGRHFTLYSAVMIVLTVLAVKTFYREKRDDAPVRNPTRVY